MTSIGEILGSKTGMTVTVSIVIIVLIIELITFIIPKYTNHLSGSQIFN